MIVRTSMVLVIVGTLFTLVGAFAPAANIGADGTPASLYQIAGGLMGWKVGAPELPASLKALETRIVGAAGLLAISAFFAIALSVFKFLRGSLIPSLLMTSMSGYLMFLMAGIRDVAVVVPNSYGWILLIAGGLVATVTGIFTLFGPGPDERRKTMTEAPKKKRGRLPFEVETTSVREPPPPKPEAEAPSKPKAEAPPKPKAEAPPEPKSDTPDAQPESGRQKVPLPKRDAPRQQRLSQVFRGDEAKPAAAPEPEAQPKETPGETPKETPKEAPKAAPKEAPKAAPPAPPKSAEGEVAKAGAPDLTPDTLSPMPASGYRGEEPTESGGWVLSGFDAKGMAVRLNISDVDLRSSDDGIVIGRNAKHCRLVLNDDSVSRRHARLSGSNPLTIEDLDSANGTVVNRKALTPGERVPIEPGVAIEIGAVRLTLVRS